MKKFVIYTDGGARGNPGKSAIGVYFSNLDKTYSEFIGEGTNNIAEYKAVIFALQKAKSILGKDKAKNTEIEIRSDSELLVNQLNGKYKIKEENLKLLFVDIWNLMQDFKKVSFTYVPREENKIADAILNETLDQLEK
jgi:ribonuclease HI